MQRSVREGRGGAPRSCEQTPRRSAVAVWMSQARQVSSQRALQHTPSVQKPLWHSPSRVQAFEVGSFARQLPLRQ